MERVQNSKQSLHTSDTAVAGRSELPAMASSARAELNSERLDARGQLRTRLGPIALRRCLTHGGFGVQQAFPELVGM